MGLDIFFLEDIRNAILAADEASSGTAKAATSQSAQTLDLIAEKLRAELPEGTSQVLLRALHAAAQGNVDALRNYRQGYRAALTTVALAFGLSPAILPQPRLALLDVPGDGQGQTLEVEGSSDERYD